MTKRERMEATLDLEEPDRIPIYDLLFNDEAISHYAKRKLTVENGPQVVLEAIGNCLDMTRSRTFLFLVRGNLFGILVGRMKRR